MKSVGAGIRSIVWLILMGQVMILGCRASDRRLIGEYRLLRIYGSAVALVYGSEETVVSANIDECAVAGDLIVGHVTKDGLSAAVAAVAKPGYFIVDTRDRNRIKVGLAREEWAQEIRSLGLTTEPVLDKARID